MDICSSVDLHGLQGDSVCPYGLHSSLQGESVLWLAFSSFFTDLGVCKAVSLMYSHSSLLEAVAQHFLPFLKYAITEEPSVTLMGSALVSGTSILELSRTRSVQH